jgi:type I restriction enzyme S subunit
MTLNIDRSEWIRTSFGEVVRHITDRVDPETCGLTRYLAGEHILSNSLHINEWGTIGDGYLGPAFYKRFLSHHVLYVSRRTYLRKVAVPGFSGICGEKTFVLETRNPDVLRQRFLPFVMSSELFHQYAIARSRGSVNPYLNWTELAKFEFDLPPASEQNRLADLLWAAEMHRHAERQRMHAFMTARRRLLVEEVLRVPAPREPLAAVGTVTGGRQRSPRYESGTGMREYLRVANVGDGFLKLGEVFKMNFTDAEFRRYNLHPGDVLVSEGQSRDLVGQCALYSGPREKYAFQNTLIRFRADMQRLRPMYAYAAIRALFYAGHFARISSQTTSIAHLGVSRFASTVIPVPSLAAQDATLARLTSLEKASDLALRSSICSDDLISRLLDGIWG